MQVQQPIRWSTSQKWVSLSVNKLILELHKNEINISSLSSVGSLQHSSICYRLLVFFAGYQIESFDNPADFFMDITNGEAKSKLNTLTAGTLYTKHTYDLFGDLWISRANRS